MSMGSGRIDTGFGSDNSMSGNGGYGGGSGFGLNTEVDSFSAKPKGLYLFYAIRVEICIK